jgi:hypothetical protein
MQNQQLITNHKHTNKSPTNISQVAQRTETEKWATFKYFGPETRTVTHVLRNTNLKITYKTTSTIKHHLKPRGEPRGIYNISGVYELQYNECPLKYIGHRGRTFKICYREHINTIRTSRQNSKFAQHTLEAGHKYDTLDQTMEILHI